MNKGERGGKVLDTNETQTEQNDKIIFKEK